MTEQKSPSISSMWVDFWMRCGGKEATQNQHDETMAAFYAGIAALLEVCERYNTASEDDRMNVLRSYAKEAMEFAAKWGREKE